MSTATIPDRAVDIAFTPAGTVAATNVQAAIEEVASEAGGALDPTLTAWGGVTFAADTIGYATGADAFSTTSLTAAARTVLDDTTVSAMLATMGGAPLASPTLANPIGKSAGTAASDRAMRFQDSNGFGLANFDGAGWVNCFRGANLYTGVENLDGGSGLHNGCRIANGIFCGSDVSLILFGGSHYASHDAGIWRTGPGELRLVSGFQSGYANLTAGAGAFQGALSAASLNLGGATQLDTLRATKTEDVGSIAAGATTTFTVTVTGAADGDDATVAIPAAAFAAGVRAFQPTVTAADTVTVTLYNPTGSPVDPASGTYAVVVRKF